VWEARERKKNRKHKDTIERAEGGAELKWALGIAI